MQFARFLRFVLVGGFATGIQYVLLIVLVHLAGVEPVTASAVGFVVSAFANYIINYHYTFGSNQRHLTALSKFAVLASIGLLLNSAIMSGLIRWGLYYLPAQLIATIIVLLWNFVGNSLWTFRAHNARAAKRGSRSRDFFLRNATVLWLLLLATSVRALIALVSDSEPGESDARAIAAAQWALDPAFGTPAIPHPFHVYLVGAFTFVAGDPIVVGKWVGLLAGSLSIIPFYRLVKRLFDEGTAWISGAFLAVYGDHVAVSSLVLSEAPSCFLALWALEVFFAEARSRAPRLLGFLSAAMLLALAGGFAPQGWLLAVILSIYLLLLPPLRQFAVPFGSTAISTLLIGSVVAGQSSPAGWSGLAAVLLDHGAALLPCSTETDTASWGRLFVRSPGPLLSGLAVWGLVLALKRRLPGHLAVIAMLLLGLEVLASVLKPQWPLQQRSAVMLGILLLPYAAAATRVLLARKSHVVAAVLAILAFSVGTQAAANQRHSRWSLPIRDYDLADTDTWNWLRANSRQDEVVLIEDSEWRAPGLIAHAGLYRQQFGVVCTAGDLNARLDHLVADRSRPYLLVLHAGSATSRLPAALDPKPKVEWQNADYRILRLGPARR